jgi:hypothetical protein
VAPAPCPRGHEHQRRARPARPGAPRVAVPRKYRTPDAGSGRACGHDVESGSRPGFSRRFSNHRLPQSDQLSNIGRRIASAREFGVAAAMRASQNPGTHESRRKTHSIPRDGGSKPRAPRERLRGNPEVEAITAVRLNHLRDTAPGCVEPGSSLLAD